MYYLIKAVYNEETLYKFRLYETPKGYFINEYNNSASKYQFIIFDSSVSEYISADAEKCVELCKVNLKFLWRNSDSACWEVYAVSRFASELIPLIEYEGLLDVPEYIIITGSAPYQLSDVREGGIIPIYNNITMRELETYQTMYDIILDVASKRLPIIDFKGDRLRFYSYTQSVRSNWDAEENYVKKAITYKVKDIEKVKALFAKVKLCGGSKCFI